MKFWEFKNVNDNEGELLLYGNIASAKPWWSDGEEGIYPKQFAEDLKALGTITNLTVRLNSNGGDVFAANAIYTQLKNHAATVTVIIEGIAASAATIIMSAADTIKAPSNALVMIHDPLLQLWGYYNAEDMDKMKNVLETVKESIMNSYIAKTGRDRQDLSDMMKNETWMTAEEAKAEGFVDEIMFEESVDASMTNDNRFMVVNSILHDMSRFQTRPVMTSKPSKPPVTPPAAVVPTPVPVNLSKAKEESEDDLKIENVQDLKQHFPDLCNQLVKDAAEQERNRIKAIDDISATVAQDLVLKAKYEEPATAEQLAFQALMADAGKGKKFVNDREEELEGAKPVAGATPKNDKAEVEAQVVDKIAASINQKRKGVQQ